MPWLAIQPSGEVITIERDVRFITNYGIQLLNAALAGEGLAFLPTWGVSDLIAEGKLEEITLENSRMDFSTSRAKSMYLLYDPSRARLGKIRATVDFLKKALSEPSTLT